MSRQDRLRATIPDLVDPQHPLVLSCFGRISLFPDDVDRRRAWEAQSSVCSECFHLVRDLAPVASRYLLVDFLEQMGEVMQAADRRVVSVLVDSGVLAHGTPLR